MVVPSVGAAAETPGPTIEHQTVTRVPMKADVEIRARITSNTRFEVFSPVIYVRLSGVPAFSRTEMKAVAGLADIYTATIPASVVTGSFDYYIEAYDQDGNGPSRMGSDKLPAHVEVFQPEQSATARPDVPVAQPAEKPAEKPTAAPLVAPSKPDLTTVKTAPAPSLVPVVAALGAEGAVGVVGATILVVGLRDFTTWQSDYNTTVYHRVGGNALSASKLDDLHHTANREISLGAVLTGASVIAIGVTSYLMFSGDKSSTTEVGAAGQAHNPSLSTLLFDF